MKKKIAFVICSNKEVFLNECLYYIGLLEVPEGYEIEVLTNHGALSMTSGYNEIIRSTNAHIYIYMHQDVFIINRRFLMEIVSIFASDEKIGLIGMVGYERVNKYGIMWKEDRIGEISWYERRTNGGNAEIDYSFDINTDLADVAMIDGLMMISSKNLEWDERFDAWDFYDASQCIRFLKKGYRIVVPRQKSSWVLHDDGKYLAVFNYGKYLRLFCELYSEFLGKSIKEIREDIFND